MLSWGHNKKIVGEIEHRTRVLLLASQGVMTVSYVADTHVNNIILKPGSRTEPEPEFYKPVLHHFFRTLIEPEP